MLKKYITVFLLIALGVLIFPYAYSQYTRIIYTGFGFVLAILVLIILIYFYFIKKIRPKLSLTLWSIYTGSMSLWVILKWNEYTVRIDGGDSRILELQTYELDYFRLVYFGVFLPLIIASIFAVLSKPKISMES
jgi:hypothetical protein